MFRAILEDTKLALATIREHKMRAFLTVLGVIIGTGTIIGVGSILAGFDGAISAIFRSFGTNSMIVFKWPPGFHGRLTPEERQRKPITLEYAAAIEERCPDVVRVSPFLMPWNFDVRGPQIFKIKYKGNDLFQIDLGGTVESFAVASGVEMLSGRFFNEFENTHRIPVVAIGEDVQKALFANIDPIGKEVDVNGHVVTVIGVMKRPAASFPGQQDNRVYLPLWTMKKMFPQAKEMYLVVEAKKGRITAAQDEVRAVLRQERRVPPSKPDNFAISTSEQMVEQFRQMMSVTALVMVVLSSIGLLVGGIGVMNIMLVSVTERTREIGVRKAIGARRLDIIIQFLTEAVVLTGLGGLIGITFGWMVSIGARFVFPTLPTMVPTWAVVLGVVVSVGIGLFFGIWPANKAARLDPVEALRYE
jgi:putative ABC transport system permease protein